MQNNLHHIAYLAAQLSGLVLLAAVVIMFVKKSTAPKPALKHSHNVATFTMTCIVLLMFPLMTIPVLNLPLYGILPYIYFAAGLLLMLFAAAWHIKSKSDIGKYWSDMVELQKNHKIITSGAYALARHPMYGSLFLWSCGCAFAMQNIGVALVAFGVLLPMLITRAKAEEENLICLDGYMFYRENVRMLLPSLSGFTAIVFKLFALTLFIYCVTRGLTWQSLFFLVMTHVLLGYSLKPEKVAFSYRSKSGMMVVIFSLSLLWPFAKYLYWLIALMFAYGFIGNCPCMIVYDKYHRCPCFALLGKFCKLQNKTRADK